jgi:hypothetical protein
MPYTIENLKLIVITLKHNCEAFILNLCIITIFFEKNHTHLMYNVDYVDQYSQNSKGWQHF